MKNFIALCLSVVMVLSLGACVSKGSQSTKFTAVVTEINDRTMLVRPIEGSKELNSSDSFSIAFAHIKDNSSPRVGDTYEIEYNGEILESYPASLSKVIGLTLISPAKESSVLSNVEIEPQCKPSMGISFGLPKGWSYEVTHSDDIPTSCTAVNLRPETAGAEGVITIEYVEGFGVCGTGLEVKQIDFNGYEATQGFYDGNSLWSYIALKGDYKNCVIINSAEWYEDYADTINKILSTIQFKYYE